MSSATVMKKVVMAFCLAAGVAAAAGTVGFASDVRDVQMMDACDPATFNAIIGPGTCIDRTGGVRFSAFISELQKHQSAGGWHFAPGVTRMREGQAVQATNHGGEVHTFTEVDEFGGGLIPDLNALSGNPDPAPECFALGPGDFIAPGHSTVPDEEDKGTHHYQCCIHPWMRTDVVVR